MAVLRHLSVFLLAAALYAAGALEPPERFLADLRFRLLPDRLPTQGLAVVDIDSRSLAQLNDWPWPRDYYATVIRNLEAAGATAVAIDIDLSSAYTAAGDAALEDALAAARIPVALPVFRQDERPIDGRANVSITEPLERFARHAQLMSINVWPGPDGKIRRMPVSDPLHGSDLPTASAFLAGIAPGAAGYYLDYAFDLTGLERLSYIDVLQNRFDSNAVRGRKILIGATALELRDHVPVPLYQFMPGVLLHALAFENIRQDRMLSRTGALPALLPALLLALVLPRVYRRLSWLSGGCVAVALGAALFAVGALIQFHRPVLVDSAAWLLVTGAAYGGVMIKRAQRQGLRLLIQKGIIRRKDAFMKEVVENSFDGIITVSQRGTVESINPAAQKIFGVTPAQVLGRELSGLLTDAGSEWLMRVSDNAGQAIEAVGRRADRLRVPLELAITRMTHHAGTIFICMVRDITERKRQTDLLRFQALHDNLTGLPNRTLLHDRMEQTLRGCSRRDSGFALLLMDLDHFKDINDTLGHHVGDMLLQQVAQRLQAVVRSADTVARLGGDEFALLLPDIKEEPSVRAIAGQIAAILEQPFSVHGLTLQLGASIGCTLFPDHGLEVGTLMQRADVAMYEAKRNKSVYAMYDLGNDNNSIRQLTLKGELKQAIEQDGLSLFYQPKVDIASNRLIGVEALVRWQHPEHGAIPPDEFVPMAERTGLITTLTQWVLERALTDCARWQKDDHPVSVALNFSTKDLLAEEFPQLIDAMLRRLGADPRWMIIEITESNMMSDPGRSLQTLHTFSRMGIRLAIDDFGTGYSSLSYLKSLPIDELKIDKSFVLNMTDDHNDLAIVRSTVDLAHHFGLKVVAEGVECEETLNQLRLIACDMAQGYHICRPIPYSELRAWMAAARAAAPADAAQLAATASSDRRRAAPSFRRHDTPVPKASS